MRKSTGHLGTGPSDLRTVSDLAIVLAHMMAKKTIKAKNLLQTLVKNYGPRVRKYFKDAYAEAENLLKKYTKDEFKSKFGTQTIQAQENLLKLKQEVKPQTYSKRIVDELEPEHLLDLSGLANSNLLSEGDRVAVRKALEVFEIAPDLKGQFKTAEQELDFEKSNAAEANLQLINFLKKTSAQKGGLNWQNYKFVDELKRIIYRSHRNAAMIKAFHGISSPEEAKKLLKEIEDSVEFEPREKKSKVALSLEEAVLAADDIKYPVFVEVYSQNRKKPKKMAFYKSDTLQQTLVTFEGEPGLQYIIESAGKRVGAGFRGLPGVVESENVAAFYEDLENAKPEDAEKSIYLNSKATQDWVLSSKLAVFLYPDKTRVLVASAYQLANTSKEGLRWYMASKIATPLSIGNSRLATGQNFFSTDYNAMIAAGFKPIASLKSKDAKRGFMQTYALKDWQDIEQSLKAKKRDLVKNIEAATAGMNKEAAGKTAKKETEAISVEDNETENEENLSSVDDQSAQTRANMLDDPDYVPLTDDNIGSMWEFLDAQKENLSAKNKQAYIEALLDNDAGDVLKSIYTEMNYSSLPKQVMMEKMATLISDVYEGTRNEKTPDKFQRDFKAKMATETEQMVAQLAKAQAPEGKPVKNNGLGTPCK